MMGYRLATISKEDWRILYSTPEEGDLSDEIYGFDACQAWIENNKVEGSKYVILKMFFV